MTEQETLLARKRGPKPTGKGVQVVVRLQPDQLAALDRWREAQPGAPSRPEAMRRLMALAVAAAPE